MHCMLSAVTCATAPSPRALDAASGPSPTKRDAHKTGIGTSQCHMPILDGKYLYSPSQARECLFHDDSKQTRNLYHVSASTVHQLHCCHYFRFG